MWHRADAAPRVGRRLHPDCHAPGARRGLQYVLGQPGLLDDLVGVSSLAARHPGGHLAALAASQIGVTADVSRVTTMITSDSSRYLVTERVKGDRTRQRRTVPRRVRG